MILVFLTQIIFSFSRTLNTRYVARCKISHSIFTGLIVKCTWLISTYLGVSAVADGDYKTIISYLVGGVIGDYISLKIKIK